MTSKARVAKIILISLFLLTVIGGFILAQNLRRQHLTTQNRQATVNNINISIDTVIEAHPTKHELFAPFYESAEKLMQTMTLEEKIGQMFLARFPGATVTQEIAKYYPGGYILFSSDFAGETKASITSKLAEYQKASPINLFLGVDEEGGSVVRVSNHSAFRSQRFASPQQLWSQGGLPAIIHDAEEKSVFLKSLGLNMNLAPVADVSTDPTSFIYDRTFGQDAARTASYIAEVIQMMKDDQIVAVLKHFPGYGDNHDTHTGKAIDNRPYEELQTNDFLPFISGIKAGVPCILVNHNVVTVIDSQLPASVSPNVHQILRKELNFSGLIITDDLAMGAIESQLDHNEAAVQAVLAGNDLIISSDLSVQAEAVLQAVRAGTIAESQIDQAVKRILACKLAYGIITSP